MTPETKQLIPLLVMAGVLTISMIFPSYQLIRIQDRQLSQTDEILRAVRDHQVDTTSKSDVLLEDVLNGTISNGELIIKSAATKEQGDRNYAASQNILSNLTRVIDLIQNHSSDNVNNETTSNSRLRL